MEHTTRIESDSVGSMQVPENVYYGVQTLRGYENFQISGTLMNWDFIKNIVKIKKVAAKINGKNGYVPQNIATAIMQACDEILNDQYKNDFIKIYINKNQNMPYNMMIYFK